MNREKLDYKHLKRFDLRDHEKEILPPGQLVLILESAVADAIVDGQDTIAIIGYIPLAGGVAHVFVYPSKHVKAYALKFFRHVRREVDQLVRRRDIKELRTFSLDDERTDRWMRALGFHLSDNGFSIKGYDYKLWTRTD